jgi:hypothetical protein
VRAKQTVAMYGRMRDILFQQETTAMTQAIRIDQPGGPEELQLVDVTRGRAGPGEIRIRHHAIGLNFIDVYHRTGLYPLTMPADASAWKAPAS